MFQMQSMVSNIQVTYSVVGHRFKRKTSRKFPVEDMKSQNDFFYDFGFNFIAMNYAENREISYDKSRNTQECSKKSSQDMIGKPVNIFERIAYEYGILCLDIFPCIALRLRNAADFLR